MIKKKTLLYFMLFFLMFMLVPAATGNVKVQAASKAKVSKVYKARAKRAKKRLAKKVKNYLSPGYAHPTASVVSSKLNIKRKALVCRVAGNIGEGAYYARIKVNLKNGRCHVLESLVDLPEYFKIKVK